MKLGNLLEKIFKYTGIKWLVNKIVIDLLGYKSCGCEERKKKLNHLQFSLVPNKLSRCCDHSIYFNHSYYKPCSCNGGKIIKEWAQQLDNLFGTNEN